MVHIKWNIINFNYDIILIKFDEDYFGMVLHTRILSDKDFKYVSLNDEEINF